jgi:hypothetical protein
LKHGHIDLNVEARIGKALSLDGRYGYCTGQALSAGENYVKYYGGIDACVDESLARGGCRPERYKVRLSK